MWNIQNLRQDLTKGTNIDDVETFIAVAALGDLQKPPSTYAMGPSETDTLRMDVRVHGIGSV